MTVPTKPGVDWAAIRLRWEAGEGAPTIAKDYPISPQAISKRCQREGWKRTYLPEEVSQRPAAGKWYDAVRVTNLGRCELGDVPEELAMVANAYGRAFHSDIAALILAEIADGIPEKTAVDCHAISSALWSTFKNADPKFEALVRAARAEAQKRRIKQVDKAADTQWQAAMAMLQHSPDSREDFGKAQGETEKGGPKVIVQVNVQRDEQVAIKHGLRIDGDGGTQPMIDVTPPPEKQ